MRGACPIASAARLWWDAVYSTFTITELVNSMTLSPEESKALNHHQGAMIVIAGSGMVTGGRILHHMRHRLPDPRTTVLLVGFQATGTRGRSLQELANRIPVA